MNLENKSPVNSIITLGSGTSTGIPMIGCQCKICQSLDHRDQRLRSSILIKTQNGKIILVDTTPDLRAQFLTNKISDIDFVIITHDHADHLHGIDDLRPLCFGPPVKEIPLYCNEKTKASIENRFSYIFNHSRPAIGGGIPKLALNSVDTMKKMQIEGIEFVFFNYPHGHGETMGFIMTSGQKNFVYIVDCADIPENIIQLLSSVKVDLMIIDCLKKGTHSTHLTVDRCFAIIQKINPEKTGLIHMSHDLSHRELTELAFQRFGKKVFPLYDQLTLTF